MSKVRYRHKRYLAEIILDGDEMLHESILYYMVIKPDEWERVDYD